MKSQIIVTAQEKKYFKAKFYKELPKQCTPGSDRIARKSSNAAINMNTNITRGGCLNPAVDSIPVCVCI